MSERTRTAPPTAADLAAAESESDARIARANEQTRGLSRTTPRTEWKPNEWQQKLIDEQIRTHVEEALRKRDEQSKVAPPPHDLEIEKAVLGAIILDSPATLPLVRAIVEPEDFYHPAHRIIFDSIVACWSRTEPVDVLTISAELRTREKLNAVGGLQYLGELTETTPTIANVEEHARITRDASIARRVLSSCHDIARDARRTRGRGDFRAKSLELLSKAATVREDRPAVTLAALAGTVADTIEARSKGAITEPGVEFEIRSLDALIPGALRDGQFTIIAAYPGGGKSTLALQLAHGASKRPKGRALFFALEMQSVALVEKVLVSEAKIDSTRARLGTVSQRELDQVFAAVSRLERTRLVLDDRSSLGIDDLRAAFVKARVDAERAGERISLVVIDYLQLMRRRDTRNQVEALEELTRELKMFAMNAGCPLVVLSQLNRAAANESRRPRMQDLRGCGSLEQDADRVLFLHEEKPGDDLVEVIVAKQREGPRDVSTTLRFVRSESRFEDLEGEVY